MKTLAILAIAVLAASHLSAQTETVLKAKATDALTESIVIPTGKSVTINSGASIINNGTATGFGGGALTELTDVTITSVATNDFFVKSAGDWVNMSRQTAINTLLASSGALVAGDIFWINSSGNVARLAGSNGYLNCFTDLGGNKVVQWATISTDLENAVTGILPVANGGTGQSTLDSWVTNTMLAGSIALSKLSITGTPNGTKFLRDDGTWAAASTDLASPGPIGGTTPSTGAFTTTTATSVVTADVPGLAITQEWNNAAVSFSALKISATNTASVSPATFPSAFLRIFVNGSEVGGFYNYYNSLSLRCQNVEMGGGSKNHGISRQSNLMWNITAADTYVAAIDSDEIRLSSLSDLTWKGDSAPYSGSPDTRIKRTAAAALKVGDATTGYGIIEDLYRRVGGGSPEGAITAPVGCIYHRTDTGDIWRKTSGTGNTGWVTP